MGWCVGVRCNPTLVFIFYLLVGLKNKMYSMQFSPYSVWLFYSPWQVERWKLHPTDLFCYDWFLCFLWCTRITPCIIPFITPWITICITTCIAPCITPCITPCKIKKGEGPMLRIDDSHVSIKMTITPKSQNLSDPRN